MCIGFGFEYFGLVECLRVVNGFWLSLARSYKVPFGMFFIMRNLIIIISNVSVEYFGVL